MSYSVDKVDYNRITPDSYMATKGTSIHSIFLTELNKKIFWDLSKWVDNTGIRCVGTTAQWDALAATSLPSGFTFWDTTTSSVRKYESVAKSITTGEPVGSTQVVNIVTLTQAQYDQGVIDGLINSTTQYNII